MKIINLKFSNLLSVTSGCPFSAGRLFSRVDVEGLGFIVVLWESCFPCVELRYASTLEQRWWDGGDMNSRLLWHGFVQEPASSEM